MHIKGFDPYDFQKKEIDGVSVYYKNIPWAPCINIRVVFNTGAFDDPVGKEGLSHFLEHMIFDGSPLLKDKKAIREWSRVNALNTWHAWTSFYNTTYLLKCLPEEYETVLKGMKDMIFRPCLRSEDVEHERKVIIQESWGRFLNEKFLKYTKEFVQLAFPGHNLSRFGSPLGWPETITKITNKDIENWHKTKYGKGNFFMVLSGMVEKEHVLKLNEFMEGLPTSIVGNVNDEIVNKPKETRIIKNADDIGEVKEQVEITIIRTCEKLAYDKNELARIYRTLLNDLLHERLRIEHSLCYNVQVSFTLEKSYSQILIAVKTDEKNIELVEQQIQQLLKEIIEGKIVDRFNVIKKTSTEQVRSQERLSESITNEALREVSKYNGHIISQTEQLKYMEAVSYDDIRDFSKVLFDPEYVCTEIILPSKKHSVELKN